MLRENDLIDTNLASETLRDRLQKGSMDQEEALLILAQIGQALHAAHQQDIVHGHVTPERVLFNTRNEALLADFPPDTSPPPEKTGEGVSQDDAIYRAPEQLAGNTSAESDQYALGCITYEMLTGCKAFRVPSVNTPGMYYKTRVLIAPGKLNPAIPPSIEEAIVKALSREPARRYRNIPDFLAVLQVASTTGDEDQEQATMAFVRETEATPITLNPVRELPETPAEIKITAAPPYGASRTSALPRKKAGKRLTTGRQKVLILIACLVVAAVVANWLFLAIKSATPAKRASTLPSASVTSIAQLPPQNGSPVPTATIPVPPTVISGQAPPPKQGGFRPTQTPVTMPTPTPAQSPTPVAAQVSLVDFLNNEGIGSAPGQANFDGSGYCYPANLLPAGGLITVDGVSYQFPGNAPLTNDNVSTSGQTIPLPVGHYRQMFLLAAASWGPVSGVMSIRYADGSTAFIHLTVLDWIAGSPDALQTPYRYNPYGIDGNHSYIYAIAITLDATRATNALVLPDIQSGPHPNGQIHVFAVTLQP